MNENLSETGSGGMSEALRSALHRREAICAEIENILSRNFADPEAEMARLVAEFIAAPEVPPEYAEVLQKRLDAAVEAVNAGKAQLARQQAELEHLIDELRQLIAAGELATYAEAEALQKKLTARGELSNYPQYADVLAEFAGLRDRLEAEYRLQQEKEQQAQTLLEQLEQLISLGNPAELKERKGSLESAFAELDGLPRKLENRFRELHRQAAMQIAQHYETIDLARWESYTLKLDLCQKLEGLQDTPESALPEAGRQLQDIRARWKQLGAVPKEKTEELNQRYLELTRQLQHRVDEFFSHRRQEQKSAAETKTALCEQAEQLADSQDWKVTAQTFKELQAQWKALPHCGSAEKDLFTRFRTAADRFFQARSKAYQEVEKHYQDIVERKKALIEQVRNADGNTFAEVRKLRDAYRSLPSAGRAEPELRREFDALMDQLFQARRAEFSRREEATGKLLSELDELAVAPRENLARARAIRAELQELNCRSLADAVTQALDRFGAALKKQDQGARKNRFATFRQLQQQLEQLRNGALAATDIATEQLSEYPKLQAACELIEAEASGDESAKAKLEKLIAGNRQEAERIVKELCPETPKPQSLAEELEAAILGNFAKKEAEKQNRKVPSSTELQRKFLNLGFIPAADLEPIADKVAQFI